MCKQTLGDKRALELCIVACWLDSTKLDSAVSSACHFSTKSAPLAKQLSSLTDSELTLV